jgi:hypothetical protein
MGVLVAVQALGMFGAVSKTVTAAAAGHDIRVIIPQWIIGVKNLMAAPAIELMFATSLA